MELKFQKAKVPILIMAPFNRTIMELKYESDLLKAKANESFNRTIMELKYVFLQLLYGALCLLIGP